LTFDKRTFDNVNMAKDRKPKLTKREVSNAGFVLGTSSWQARVERFTPEQLREQLSRAGKLGGRPPRHTLVGKS
jgi:hypothetical protein